MDAAIQAYQHSLEQKAIKQDNSNETQQKIQTSAVSTDKSEHKETRYMSDTHEKSKYFEQPENTKMLDTSIETTSEPSPSRATPKTSVEERVKTALLALQRLREKK